MAIVSVGMPSIAIRPPWAMLAIMSRKRIAVAGHLEPDVESFLHAELASGHRPTFRDDIERAGHAHLPRELEPVGFTSVTTTWRAPAWRTTAAAIGRSDPRR